MLNFVSWVFPSYSLAMNNLLLVYHFCYICHNYHYIYMLISWPPAACPLPPDKVDKLNRWFNSTQHSILHSNSLCPESSSSHVLNESPPPVWGRQFQSVCEISSSQAILQPPRTLYLAFYPWHTWCLLTHQAIFNVHLQLPFFLYEGPRDQIFSSYCVMI